MKKKPLTLALEHVDKPSFSTHFRLGRFRTAWHSHRRHKLLFAESGMVHVEQETASFLLPAHHGAWIPADVAHSLRSNSRQLMMRAHFFDPAKDHASDITLPAEVVIFPISTLANEILRYTERWNYDHPWSEAEAAFFDAIRALIPDWCARPIQLVIPVSQDATLQQITSFIQAHLDTGLTAQQVAAHFAMSSRTLLRLFQKDLQMTFQQYVRIARIVLAAELLFHEDKPITRIALDVGYSSTSAFTRAFNDLTGLSPSAYRQLKDV